MLCSFGWGAEGRQQPKLQSAAILKPGTWNLERNFIIPDSVIFEQKRIIMQAETNRPLKGIHYLTDSDNNRIAVQIDLKMYGELWQEFMDRLVIEFRKDEESDSFEDFLNELKEEGMLDE